MTDEELLGQAMRADERAFCQLYQRYRDPLFRFAYRLTGSAPSAEDIVHDCFVSVIEHADRYESGRASVGAYLFGTVRNLSAKWSRNFAREYVSDDADCPAPGHEVPDHVLLVRETAQQVRRAVMSLPRHQREVLVLRDFEGLPLRQIAEIVEANPGVVKSRLHRARESLRRALEEFVGGPVGLR